MSKTVREYPNITPKAGEMLVELARKLENWPDFFTHEDFKKYPEDIQQALHQLWDASKGGSIDITAESKFLYKQLKSTLQTIEKMETSEKVQIFRTATSLQEKLLALTERAEAIDQYSNFKAVVVRMLERYLTPVQLSEFVEEVAELTRASKL